MTKAKRNVMALTACLAAVAVSLWVHRRALGVFFSTDDLISLERVTGVLPPHPMQLWRYLSDHAYFTLALRLFGPDPLPYHLTNWLLHGLNVALLFALVRRWGGSIAAAGMAAIVSGASRVATPVLIQTVEINDVLALTGTLAMLLLFDVNRPRRVGLACVAFALAMLRFRVRIANAWQTIKVVEEP